MRSIVEEASTLEKAITSAWNKAGNPPEFSVKILELPQYNFFGFTKQSAKIALFFSKKPRSMPEPSKKGRPPRQVSGRPRTKAAPTSKGSAPDRSPDKQMRQDSPWTSNMVSAITDWLTSVIKLMNKQNVTFSSQVKQNLLVVTLEKPLLANKGQNQRLLTSLSHFMLKFLRLQFKEETKYLKIVLQSTI